MKRVLCWLFLGHNPELRTDMVAMVVRDQHRQFNLYSGDTVCLRCGKSLHLKLY